MKRDPWLARAAVWVYLHTVWHLFRMLDRVFRK